ncbi:hypothetical protein SLA2020_445030 [Shorea laevis]
MPSLMGKRLGKKVGSGLGMGVPSYAAVMRVETSVPVTEETLAVRSEDLLGKDWPFAGICWATFPTPSRGPLREATWSALMVLLILWRTFGGKEPSAQGRLAYLILQMKGMAGSVERGS